MEFEWDQNKNQSNQLKHGISFEEASEIFRYPMHEIADTHQDYGEIRYIGIGRNNTMSTVRKHDSEIPPMSEERAKAIQAKRDEDIDYSDIPELDEAFFQNATLVKRQPNTEAISIRVDTDTLEWFRETAKNHPNIRGYQTLINDVLRTYVTHQTAIPQRNNDNG